MAKVAASLEGRAFVVRVGEVAVGWVAGDCGDGDFLAFEGFGGLFGETIEEGGLRKSGGEQVFNHKLAVDLYVIFSNCVCLRARLGDNTSAHVLFITLVIRHAHLGLFFNTPALLLSSAICAELHSFVTAVSALSSFKKHPSLHHGDSLPQASVVLPLLILDHPGTFVASFKIIVLSFLLEVFASPSSEESDRPIAMRSWSLLTWKGHSCLHAYQLPGWHMSHVTGYHSHETQQTIQCCVALQTIRCGIPGRLLRLTSRLAVLFRCFRAFYFYPRRTDVVFHHLIDPFYNLP